MSKIGIGVDIGGSHIVCCAIDMASGQPIAHTHAEEKVNNKGSKDEILETWAKAINKTIEKIDIASLAGIGFAMPGPFKYKTGVAMFEGTDKYEKLYNVDIKANLSPFLSVKDIEMRFMNDASAFAVGTTWFGEAKNTERSISITLGTGFGSALIDRDLPVVKRGDAPEHGCFWHLPYKDAIADDYFSTRWFVNSYERLTGIKIKGVKEVAMKAEEGNQFNDLFIEFGENMADFMITWLKKFKPEVLVIGGNVSRAFDLFYPSFRDKLVENDIQLKVEISKLMEDAALIGSARLFDESFWEKVKDDLPEI
ncbi:ROK family protein [Reichenbachiella sp. MALMAid0571]|uniref:ROK family protein n=1 Tax=Reichenbachiella sp. MALMAid0571 TaxID=3143939 RepID=UPI0032DFDBE0